MNPATVPFGPTYDEMLHPQKLPASLRRQARQVLTADEFDPLNLFNITWRDSTDQVRKLVFPRELTGVEANIIVMLGGQFPSGSHKVGPAYATLLEGCLDGEILPEIHTILGPSTGNFGIGVAYICRLMGYRAVVIMPDNMSPERYARIRYYGAELDLTPGTESDVVLTLQRTRERCQDPHNRALAQFELMPNYRFHRHVTGHSAIAAVQGIGNGRIAAFCSAPGSAGTLAAGDAIKQAFPECKIVALEPYECATLARNGRGQHRIEGIGDKMCTLIHNVRTTDFVALLHDDDCVRALKIIQEAPQILQAFGVAGAAAASLRDVFGISALCNILGAIKMARYLRLGPDDNVVTIATDRFDRYGSVLRDLDRRYLETTGPVLERWTRDIFLGMTDDHVYDFRRSDRKELLFRRKEQDWLPFGYSQAQLDAMRDPDFWELAYQKVFAYDQRLLAVRRPL